MIGKTVSHYRILEKIGQGGMGEVFLAHDISLEREVALKFLPDIFSGDPEWLARFEREAKILGSIKSSRCDHCVTVRSLSAVAKHFSR